MILTITTNPSVDIRYQLDSFLLDAGNRVDKVNKTAGGKGLNVSRVLRQLDEKVAATGFLGGSLGQFIREEISKLGIKDYFVDIDGATRNCIAIIHDDGAQTEILESGPHISDDEVETFLKKIFEDVQAVNLVTISGSNPKGISDQFYGKLIEIANSHQKPVLLDTKGELLEKTLKSGNKPFLIKPNQEEFSDLLGVEKVDINSIFHALQSFTLFADIPWIVITMGSQGAIVKHEENAYHVTIPTVEAVNPVGSGDSVIAGFASGITRGYDDEQLIRYGLSMGVLNAMEDKTGYINPSKIAWCMEKITIDKINN